jgi:L-amino acid N-acyltransferase YncA
MWDVRIQQGEETMLDKQYPKEVLLKDGREVIFKTPDADDCEALMVFYRHLPEEDRWFFKEDPTKASVIRRWVANHLEKRAFCVIAIYANRIVAHAALLLRPLGGRRHVGRLRVTVARDFRGDRLGTWLIFDLMRRAMELGLEKLRADFVVGIEDAAIEAVQRLDFFKEGLLTDYVLGPDGRYHDYQIMIKHLHKEWGDF